MLGKNFRPLLDENVWVSASFFGESFLRGRLMLAKPPLKKLSPKRNSPPHTFLESRPVLAASFFSFFFSNHLYCKSRVIVEKRRKTKTVNRILCFCGSLAMNELGARESFFAQFCGVHFGRCLTGPKCQKKNISAHEKIIIPFAPHRLAAQFRLQKQ